MVMTALGRINVPKQTPTDNRLASVHLRRLLCLHYGVIKIQLLAPTLYLIFHVTQTYYSAFSCSLLFFFFFLTQIKIKEWEAGERGESQ